jgi:hypothetical protein
MGANQGKTSVQCEPWACSGHFDMCEPRAVKSMKSQPVTQHKSNARKRCDDHVGMRIPETSDVQTEYTKLSMSDVRMAPRNSYSRDVILLALTKADSPKIMQYHEPPPNEEGWTEKEDAQLNSAVKYIANFKHMHVPKYEQLSRCYKDGMFLDEVAKDFWHCVAIRVSSRDAAACYRRYNQAHGSGIARFKVAGRNNVGAFTST